jgi:hypothetical protein
MPARPLSPDEMQEAQNMVAECDLNPDRRLHYFAELIRLREFANYASRYRGRLPIKVREAFERDVPAKSERLSWIEAGAENAIEDQVHQPDPVKPVRSLF